MADNLIANPNFSGAVNGVIGSGGVLPTGMSVLHQGADAITVTVVGTGVDATGGPYLDIRFSGTPGATDQVQLFFTADTDGTAIVINPGVAAFSMYLALTAGAMTNFGGTGNSVVFFAVDLQSSSHVFITNALEKFSITPTSTITQFTADTALTLAADTAFLHPYFTFNLTSGSAVDGTFRIAGVSLTQSPSPFTFVNVATSTETTTTALTLSLPASIAKGDLLVAMIAYRGVTSGGTVTLPANWIKIDEQNSGDSDTTSGIGNGCLAYIIRGTSDPAVNVTLPIADVGRAYVTAYRGVDVMSPLGAHISSTMGVINTSLSGTGLTTTGINDLVVFGVGCGDSGTLSAFAATDPALSTSAIHTAAGKPAVGAWKLRADTSSTSGADMSGGIADAVRSAAGATGSFTATVGISSRAAIFGAAFHAAGTAGPVPFLQQMTPILAQ